MNQLSIQELIAAVPPALLKKAEKAIVRELDEEPRGHFVAYVDEGSSTFDVSVQLDKQYTLVNSLCDCGKKGVCVHQVAVMLQITGKKTTKKPLSSVKKNKVNQYEQLLMDTDPEELKEWVKNLLSKNKDLQLSFVIHFNDTEIRYTPEDWIKLTLQTARAVIKSKRNVDSAQLKKVTDLWADLHKPVLKAYLANTADKLSFDSLHSVIETCMLFDYSLETSSNKIIKYIESLLTPSAEIIATLHTEEAWTSATLFFVAELSIPKAVIKPRRHYLSHLIDIINISSPERRKQLTGLLANHYWQLDLHFAGDSLLLDNTMLDLLIRENLLEAHYDLCKPIYYQREYNVKLINGLIRINQWVLAEKYCNEQLTDNPLHLTAGVYLSLLKTIYTAQNNDTKLIQVLERLLPLRYDFEDYLTLLNKLPDEESRIKLQTRLTRSANTSSGFNLNMPAEFCFRLLDHERNYAKMTSLINPFTSAKLLSEYFEKMVNSDKDGLLKAILTRTEQYPFGPDYYAKKQFEEKYYPIIFDLMISHYGEQHIKTALLNNKPTYRGPTFLKEYISKRLFAPG